MLKFRANLTNKLKCRANRTMQNSRIKRIAHYTSLVFAMLVAVGISHLGSAHIAHDIRVTELEREHALALKAEKMQQTVCLTNIVHHEARGEKPHVRKLVANVVRAMAADPFFSKAKTVCDLGKIGGMFSQIKYVTEVRAAVPLWNEVHTQMTQTMDEKLELPAGWGCVRAFRISDDELEKMSGKSLHQLGFTVSAKGLKYFAAALVPVDTEGSVTFYSKRGGCKRPTQTALR